MGILGYIWTASLARSARSEPGGALWGLPERSLTFKASMRVGRSSLLLQDSLARRSILPAACLLTSIFFATSLSGIFNCQTYAPMTWRFQRGISGPRAILARSASNAVGSLDRRCQVDERLQLPQTFGGRDVKGGLAARFMAWRAATDTATDNVFCRRVETGPRPLLVRLGRLSFFTTRFSIKEC
jgi:hypothetical protein